MVTISNQIVTIMNTNDFVSCVVLRIPCEFIDKLCDEYDLDFGDEDIEELLNCCSGDCFHESHYNSVGNMLVRRLFQDIIDKYNDVLDEEKFDYYIDGNDSNLIYDGETIHSKKELDAIYDRVEEEMLEIA